MSTQNTEAMSVRILPNTTGNPPGKLADAEVIFEADAGPFTRSPLFQAKLVLIALGVINAWAFRWRFGDFDDGERPAVAAQMAAP